ncbi:hypothetical protein K488DRAFT_83091 [Vararia minispora EC-137]|uniref:Uncharacterized protein n=1 Tax=Vararia minispora EC-137 TaxID=1314806 RepID=A0ACB8QU80_9AGAM|nr:hypothetical protein K488DRAFT_83091 [Vararia minispora EC-137]
MAAVISTQTLPQSAHFLGSRPSHNAHTFGQRKQQRHVPQQHNGFGAFAPHHHSSMRSPASASASWRVHSAPEPAVPASPSPSPSSSPRRASPAPSRPAESVSHRPAPIYSPSSSTTQTRPAFVYSPEELLRLAQSPQVGISAEKSAVLKDIVEHFVWRRGPSGSPSRSRSPRSSARTHSRRSSSPSGRSSGSSAHVHSDSD